MTQEIFPVPEEWARTAKIDAARYDAMYARSVDDPEGFWREESQRIDWIEPYSKIIAVVLAVLVIGATAFLTTGPRSAEFERALENGVTPAELPSLAQAVSTLPGLRFRGLMALPAPTPDERQQREAFLRVRQLFDSLRRAGMTLDTLSMGMSDDLEAAVAEGATIVRIGTAIFGPRG